MQRIFFSAALMSISTAAIATSAVAEERKFDIEAGSLQDALDSFARQAGRPIIYRVEDVRGATSPGYSGSASADRVLPLLLASSDFAIRSQPSGAVAVVRMGNVTSAPRPVADAGNDLGDIVVTARRTAERAQKTPVSVTSFNTEQLQNKVIQDTQDLARVTPSFQAKRNNTNTSGLQLQMRAQVQSDTTAIAPGSVGVYLDDVYIGGAPIAGGLLLPRDLDRVEVLKGPQGTLYGRNVTGGVLKFVSHKPEDKFGGYLTAGLGNYDRRFLDGMINVPLTDKVAIRLNGSIDENGGYSKDINNNNRPLDDDRRWGLRGALKAELNDTVQVLLQGWYGKGYTNGPDDRTTYVDPTNVNAIKNIIATQHLGGLSLSQVQALDSTGAQYADLRSQALALVTQYANAPRNQARQNPDDRLAQRGVAKLGGGALTFSADLGDITLRSITAYSYAFRDSNFSVGGGPWIPIYSNQSGSVSQWTQEFQATGTAFDSRLKFAAGIYLIDQNLSDNRIDSSQFGTFPAYLGQLGLGLTNGTRSENSIKDKGWAGYGQATVAVTDTVNLTGGLRYTWEKFSLKTRQLVRSGTSFTCSTPTLPLTTPVANCLASDSISFSNWSFTAGADWSPVNDVMLYGKFSRGFKSGGINPFGVGGAPAFLPFKPEIADEFEVGLKSQFLNRRGRFNLAYYHTNYKDVQRTVGTIIRPATETTPPQTGTGIQNAASAKIDGIEAELTVAPVAGLTLSATGAWTRPRYAAYSQVNTAFPGGLQDLRDQKFELVPEWMYNLGAVYRKDVSFGSVTASVDWAWRSDTMPAVRDVFPSRPGGPTTPVAILTQPSFGLLNASLRFDLPAHNLAITLWGKNVTNKRYAESAGALVASGVGYAWNSYGAPATYGADVTVRF